MTWPAQTEGKTTTDQSKKIVTATNLEPIHLIKLTFSLNEKFCNAEAFAKKKQAGPSGQPAPLSYMTSQVTGE
jgi:hypothetical protein